MPTLMDILRQNSGMARITPNTNKPNIPVGTNGYDFGSGTDPGDFYRNVAIGNQGLYSNDTKNYLGVGGAGWNPAAASAGYLASQGGPDNPIGYGAWARGDKQYVDAFGAPPPQGTTFDQFRTGIGLSTTPGVGGTPTLYNPPPGAPGYGGAGGTTGGTTGGITGGTPYGPASGGAANMAPVQKQTSDVDWSKIDISKFMDPNVDYRIQKGSQAIQNSAAARGNLLSGNTLKGINDYAQNEANNSYQQAQNAAFNDRSFMRGNFQNDRDYTTALDEWNKNFGEGTRRFDTGTDLSDRQFDYNAQVGDRNFNYQRLSDLANLGLQGANGGANLQRLLATLISSNTIAGGTAGAQGTIGGSNAINNMISQIIAQMNGNNLLNRIAPGP